MAAHGLFRMDELLFKAALWTGALAAVVVSIFVSGVVDGGGERTGSAALWLAALVAAPLAMALVGWRIRRREKRALALWRLVEEEVEFAAADLIRDSDWTPASLERAIRDLNNSGLAYVVWDRRAGLVQDGRLRRKVVVVDECRACSAKIQLEVVLGGAARMSCSFCGEPVDSGRLAEEKARVLDELDAEGREADATPRARIVGQGDFSLPLFFVLTMVFWPGAVWYAWSKRQLIGDALP